MPRRAPVSHKPRFASIKPHHFQRGTVYAVELSNGVVKLGHTRCPRVRFPLLANEIRPLFGEGTTISRFHVGPDLTDRAPLHVERELIALARTVATPVNGRREYFRDLSFSAALSLIRDVLRMQAGEPEQNAAA